MKKLMLFITVVGSFIAYNYGIRGESFAEGNLVSDQLSNPTPSYQPANPSPSLQTITPTPSQANAVVTTNVNQPSSGKYRDGSYTGRVADAYYGNVQVRVTVTGGDISNVEFIQTPSGRGRTMMINMYATPILAQEAIKAQSANVDIVSGATDTSQAFIDSLSDALSQAKI